LFQVTLPTGNSICRQVQLNLTVALAIRKTVNPVLKTSPIVHLRPSLSSAAMPPIRTRNKKSRGRSALPGLGFTPVIGLEAYERATTAAEQRAAQSAGETTTCLTSEIEETRLVDEGPATHAIGESEEACEFAPTQAELEVKEADAAQKTSMPMNRGQKEVTFRDNQEWRSNHRKWLGYETKRVAFGSSFILKEYVPSHKILHSRLRTRTNSQVASISTS
jgi:hypothetical protein